MTHDPLCSHSRQFRWFQKIDECQCDLIAKARADEREAATEKILAYSKLHHPKHDPRIACIRCDIDAAYKNAANIVIHS